MRLDLAPCNATRVLSSIHHKVGTLIKPYSEVVSLRSLKYVPWACYPVWLRRGLTTQDEGMQLDHAPYHSM